MTHQVLVMKEPYYTTTWFSMTGHDPSWGQLFRGMDMSWAWPLGEKRGWGMNPGSIDNMGFLEACCYPAIEINSMGPGVCPAVSSCRLHSLAVHDVSLCRFMQGSLFLTYMAYTRWLFTNNNLNLPTLHFNIQLVNNQLVHWFSPFHYLYSTHWLYLLVHCLFQVLVSGGCLLLSYIT